MIRLILLVSGKLETARRVSAEVWVLISAGDQLEEHASWLQVRMAEVGFYLASGTSAGDEVEWPKSRSR